MPESVIAVIKRLPFLSSEDETELAPDTLPLNYLELGHALDIWQDPFSISNEPDPAENYLGKCVPITDCKGQGGWFFIYDIDTGSVLIWFRSQH